MIIDDYIEVMLRTSGRFPSPPRFAEGGDFRELG